jgi:hypothetical protein
MKERCLNPRNHKYPRYGARGIKIHPTWIDSFETFYEHVSTLANCGEKGFTIDRVDNDGDYEPGNVRWATPFEQQRNTSQNLMLTLNGITRCAVEWAELLGINAKTLRGRIEVGWSHERALTQPIRKFRQPRQTKRR